MTSNAVFEKTAENVIKHRDIKLVTTEKRKNYLETEPNYLFYTENLLAIEMKKAKKKNRVIYQETCPFRTVNTRIK